MIRLFQEEQSDLDQYCQPTPVCPKTLDHYGLNKLWFREEQIIRSCQEFEDRIDKLYFPSVTGWHSEALLSDAKK